MSTLTLLFCLNHLHKASSILQCSGFHRLLIFYPLTSNGFTIFALILQIIWTVELTKPNSWHTSVLVLPFSISRFNFFFSHVKFRCLLKCTNIEPLLNTVKIVKDKYWLENLSGCKCVYSEGQMRIVMIK